MHKFFNILNASKILFIEEIVFFKKLKYFFVPTYMAYLIYGLYKMGMNENKMTHLPCFVGCVALYTINGNALRWGGNIKSGLSPIFHSIALSTLH